MLYKLILQEVLVYTNSQAAIYVPTEFLNIRMGQRNIMNITDFLDTIYERTCVNYPRLST